MEDLYTQQFRKKARRITKDPSHPRHRLICLPTRLYHIIRVSTSRLRDGFIPQDILTCDEKHAEDFNGLLELSNK
ncbi:hypothetical protein L3Q82_025243 [Scortum barcoo]|uniref:Uncharacterized protein n=1 Tax=Scortum barcoo TaxID=214431 RepID=A0ACB8WRX8_9TELE|nr:hypothetical protein L3Q82_025243 [Scortum barcoo]